MVPGELLIIIQILTAFLMYFFSFFLITRKKGKRTVYWSLAGFLLASAILLTNKIFFFYHIFESFPHLFLLGYPFILFFSPMLYFFTQSLTKDNFRFEKESLFHLLPFFGSLTYFVIFFHPLIFTSKTIRVPLGNHKLDSVLKWMGYACELQYLIYTFVCLYLLYRYRDNIKNYYSSIETINLSWLTYVLYTFTIWRVLFLIRLHHLWPVDVINQSALDLLIELGFLVFVMVLIFKALIQPEIFFDSENMQQKTRKFQLPADKKESYLKQLLEFMQTTKPFLDSNISIKELAEQADIPSYYLSYIINECLHQNFFDFINNYRIKESQRLIKRHLDDKTTILEIVYESGFNSKSVFNTAFKKHTGSTPSEYRKNLIFAK